MGCSTCHDPHRHPKAEEKPSYYRSRCLKCHNDQSCAVAIPDRKAKSPTDSCIDCHMPRLKSEVQHTSITDHRIPRRPDRQPVTTRPAMAGPDDLVPFHQALVASEDPEVERNLGIALMGMLELRPPAAMARQYATKGLPLLKRAFERDPSDVRAGENLAQALDTLDRAEESLALYQALVGANPKRESVLHSAAMQALRMNRIDLAEKWAEAVSEINPWHWQYPHMLARTSFRAGNLERAVRECNRSLSIDIVNTPTRSLLVQCLLRLGRLADATKEFEVLRRLTPVDRRPELQRWFDDRQAESAPISK